MVIMSVLAVMTTSMITLPVQSYVDQEGRTRLVDDAESALRRMQRDLRQALPNSIRITGGGQVLEMLHVLDAGRYRANKDGTLAANAGLCASDPAGDVLDFTAADSCFQVLGSFSNFNPQATAGEFLVIYNLNDAAYLDINSTAMTDPNYQRINRIAVTNSGNAGLVKFAAIKFPLSSPQQRFFIVDTAITYRCNISTGQLLRYSGYTISAAQPNPPAVTGQLQAEHVSACNFTYASGAATRAGLVTAAVTLTNADGEAARLMQQMHVDNAP